MNKKIPREIILYGIFGVLTTVVNFLVFKVCADLIKTSTVLSTAVAWFISVVFAYITNRVWVFESKEKNTLKESSNFFMCRAGTGILDVIIMYITVDIFFWNKDLMKILSNILVIIINYIASKIFVFKNN